MAKKPIQAEPRPDAATEALKAFLDAIPGAVARPMAPARSAIPIVVLYKVFGKMFAILSLRGDAFMVVKCDPHLADELRQRYAGIGHRTHLDRRFWISVEFGSDVPLSEAKRLALQSYDLICAELTKKQRSALQRPDGEKRP